MEQTNEQVSEQVVPSNKSNWVWPILVVLLILVGGFFVLVNQNDNLFQKTTTPQEISTVTVTDESPITVEGGKHYFKPNEIRVKKGQTVKITFNNVEGEHDFVLDEFNVQSSELEEDESEEITFVADKTGEFEFYCSLYDHREKGMYGKLIVTE